MPTRTSHVSSRAPKKHLGQHFLTAPYYARRIAESVPARPDERVLEIGPGTGALSVHLKERFQRYHCVEKDADVIPRLRERLGPGEYTIHHADILTFDLSAVGFPLHVVGNLPYNVAARILKKVLLCGSRIHSCTCMVQREVAERIAAAPGSKRMGFLSVFCQFFGETRLLFRVPPGAFFPKPKVESAVVRILIDQGVERTLPPETWPAFFAFVDSGFRMRRKKLVNALTAAYPENKIGESMERLGMATARRAEELSVGEWVELYRDSLVC